MLDRVSDWQSGNDAFRSFKLGNDMTDQVSGHKGAGRIMNQHPLDACGAARGNTNAARILTRGPDSGSKQVLVPRANNGLNVGHAGMLGESLERPPNHRPAAN
jgi:hypothetical protein